MKVLLWAGPYDGVTVEVEQWGPDIQMPDFGVPANWVVYEATSKMKGSKRVYRLAKPSVGC